MRLRPQVNINLSSTERSQYVYISNVMFCNAELNRTPGCAPSVLITFINMMLFKNAVVPEGCSQYMFEGQYVLQLFLLSAAFLCVPVMLFGKPLYVVFIKRLGKPGKIYVSNPLFCPVLFNYYYLLIKLLIIIYIHKF